MNEAVKAKIADWALSGTTGASAEAIAAHLGGVGICDGSYPHDGGDFDRCERLLNMVPELRPHLSRMATVNNYWAALVPKWEEIKASPDKYALMKSILRPIQDADPRVIRLGDGVLMSFGKK